MFNCLINNRLKKKKQQESIRKEMGLSKKEDNGLLPSLEKAESRWRRFYVRLMFNDFA